MSITATINAPTPLTATIHGEPDGPITATVGGAPTGITADVSGQGPAGVPGSFSALREYWLNDYGGGPAKSAAENDAAFAAILLAGGASTGTWYTNLNEGGLIRFAGKCQFATQWSLPKHWGIRGLGMTLSALLPATATAQLAISARGNSGYRFSASGDFTIDGSGVASTVPLLYMGKLSEGMLQNVEVINAAGTGILLESTQNVDFLNVNAQLCGGSGLVLDYGVGGCLFARCEINGNGRYNVELKGTGGYAGTNVPNGNNTWLACILERGTATTLGMLYVGAGIVNRFLGCNLAWGDADAGTTAPLATVEVANSDLGCLHTEFSSCTWNANGALVVALRATGACSIELTGTNRFTACTSAPISLDSSVTFESGALLGGAPLTQSSLRNHSLFTTVKITRNANDDAMQLWLPGESNPRFRLIADGTMTMGPGTAGTDCNFRRAGGPHGARWKTDQQMAFGGGTAGTGIRVGDLGLWVSRDWAAVTWDPPSVADGAMTSTTVAASGAVVGDVCQASFSNAVPAGAILGAQVMAPDTITVTLINHSGAPLDLASGTLRVVWDRY